MATKFLRLAIVQTGFLLRFGRCYSMQVTSFWHKPPAVFNGSVRASSNEPAFAAFTDFEARYNRCQRFPETYLVAKIKRVRTIQVRTLRYSRNSRGLGKSGPE